jgi:hypothetical protein
VTTTTTPSVPLTGALDAPVVIERPGPAGRGWALAGVGAGVAGIASIVGSSLSGAVYDEDNHGDPQKVADAMADMVPQILLFHTATMVSCALLVVFAAGLHRQLRHRAGADSLLPGIAVGGLGLTAVALLMGAGLTTEFLFAADAPAGAVAPESVAFFGHWIGTIPWLWGGAGLAALAMAWAALRQGAYPRWIAWTSVVLGGLTALFLVSPLQYMAGMTGPVWLTVVSLGLALSRRRD